MSVYFDILRFKVAAKLQQYTDYLKQIKHLQKSWIRYLLVGGISYLLEMGFLALFHKTLGLSALWSVALSFWLGFVISFSLQKIITFKNYDKQPKTLRKQLSSYMALLVWNYIFTLLLVQLLTPRLSVFIVRTLAIATITMWNYYLYKTRIFKTNENPIY